MEDHMNNPAISRRTVLKGWVAQAIRRLNESEIETLLAGDFRIDLVVGNQKNPRKKNSISLNFPDRIAPAGVVRHAPWAA